MDGDDISHPNRLEKQLLALNISKPIFAVVILHLMKIILLLKNL